MAFEPSFPFYLTKYCLDSLFLVFFTILVSNTFSSLVGSCLGKSISSSSSRIYCELPALESPLKGVRSKTLKIGDIPSSDGNWIS